MYIRRRLTVPQQTSDHLIISVYISMLLYYFTFADAMIEIYRNTSTLKIELTFS